MQTDAADAACVNNHGERDAACRRCRHGAEIVAGCVSRALSTFLLFMFFYLMHQSGIVCLFSLLFSFDSLYIC